MPEERGNGRIKRMVPARGFQTIEPFGAADPVTVKVYGDIKYMMGDIKAVALVGGEGLHGEAKPEGARCLPGGAGKWQAGFLPAAQGRLVCRVFCIGDLPLGNGVIGTVGIGQAGQQ